MWTDRRTDKRKEQTTQRETDVQTEKQRDMTMLTVAFRYLAKRPEAKYAHTHTRIYEGWNFNSGNYLFTTDTK